MAQTGRRNWSVLYYNAARTTPSQREPLGVGRPSLAHSLCPHAPLMREKVGTRSSELNSDQDVVIVPLNCGAPQIGQCQRVFKGFQRQVPIRYPE